MAVTEPQQDVSRTDDRALAFVSARTGPDRSTPIILSAQHVWTGGLETAGPGCYDAVAIARAAGFRMLVMSRIRHATIVH